MKDLRDDIEFYFKYSSPRHRIKIKSLKQLNYLKGNYNLEQSK